MTIEEGCKRGEREEGESERRRRKREKGERERRRRKRAEGGAGRRRRSRTKKKQVIGEGMTTGWTTLV